ncbi:MAG: MAPEG family protein [Gammaproteobacteria bacterium]|nr:MAPEG family protein [Pseudomonadales bacterium]MCP5348670.1 MAPEG family protein [Pseudomonadales bacterium]
MQAVHIVIGLAVLQYFFFGLLVGRARGKYNVPAPATSGDPMFERYNRVHQNTQESLLLFLPGILIYSLYFNPTIAAGLGVIWIIGRFVYLRAYIKDPKTRGLGFALTALPSLFLLIAGLIGAVLALI